MNNYQKCVQGHPTLCWEGIRSMRNRLVTDAMYYFYQSIKWSGYTQARLVSTTSMLPSMILSLLRVGYFICSVRIYNEAD